jgi:adenine-specific DNA-methyltransferase
VLAENPETSQLKLPLGPEVMMKSEARQKNTRAARLSLDEATAVLRRKLQSLQANPREFSSTGDQYRLACSATRRTLEAYWEHLQRTYAKPWPLAPLKVGKPLPPLSEAASEVLEEMGYLVARHDPVTAGYLIGEVYTALLPKDFRSENGVFFTPPALTHRLLALASTAGVDWARAFILDPACGGGAFLTPVALRIASALDGKSPKDILSHISEHLRGFELDPFSAWMSQVLLESALMPLCRKTGKRLSTLVTVCDALAREPDGWQADLVIGNPPYGRVTLEPALRARYRRSLHGHANAYGLFMDLAVRCARPGGVIAYITPTGFLGGRYFKELRSLMAQEAPPVSIDLVTSRKGVFSNVLQETLLATYRKGGESHLASVHLVTLASEAVADVSPAGSFSLPMVPTEPWLIPRGRQQAALISRLNGMPFRLADYGYKVSTGPLVWNRHKSQLHGKRVRGSYPILWAECVTSDGRFEPRTEKRNHKPYLKPERGQDWLLIREPCVLVQRTTSKEQRRRLLAAELPVGFIQESGAVSVENHLNMVRPTRGRPEVSLETIAAMLNSAIVDAAFRCISGSVAVSATELESLPLPSPSAAHELESLLESGATRDVFERRLQDLYMRERADVAA